MTSWFYIQDGRKYGPLSGADMKQLAASGQLRPWNTVSREGSTKWVPANEVKGLFAAAVAAEPPPIQHDGKSSNCAPIQVDGKSPAPNRRWSGIALGLGLLFLPPIALIFLTFDPVRRRKPIWWACGLLWGWWMYFRPDAFRVERRVHQKEALARTVESRQDTNQPVGGNSGKWGFIDKSGKIIVPGQYDYAQGFSEGLAGVEQAGKWGYIDISGKLKINYRFGGCKAFRNGTAQAWIDHDTYHIDKLGNGIQPAPKQLIPFKAGGKYGCKNGKGDVVFLPQFDFAPEFTDGVAFVTNELSSGMIDASGNFLVKFTDRLLILEGIFDPNYGPAHALESGLIPFERLGDTTWGCLDKRGRIAIPPRFAFPSHFSEGLAAATIGISSSEIETMTRTGVIAMPPSGVGYIDRHGEFVIIPQFDDGRAFSSGLAAVKVADSGGKWGFIDKSGHIVIKPVFDEAPTKFTEGLSCIKVGGLVGFIDRTGNVVIKPQFLDASHFSEGLAAVKFR
jgi:WG containing repeat/GYF domain 2